MQAAAPTLFEGFGNVFVFCVFGALFVFLNLYVIGKLIMRRPQKPGMGEKETTIECGEPTIGDAWIRFDIRFYTISLIFLIFDIEVTLLFPWATVYNEFIAGGYGAGAFLEALFFLVVLGVGLAYVWVRRDIDWTSTKPGRALSDEAIRDAVVAPPEPAKEGEASVA
jgi:NADH-quinone oxidoreductase subunit A